MFYDAGALDSKVNLIIGVLEVKLFYCYHLSHV